MHTKFFFRKKIASALQKISSFRYEIYPLLRDSKWRTKEEEARTRWDIKLKDQMSMESKEAFSRQLGRGDKDEEIRMFRFPELEGNRLGQMGPKSILETKDHGLLCEVVAHVEEVPKRDRTG